MSKRKGLSLDDKRAKMLEIFHETSDVFMLKDVEKLSSKKGIISQSVKEVLQSLVDDDLVCVERIGISNYYWSFLSEASVKLENELKRLSESEVAIARQRADLEQQVAAAKAGKEDTQARGELTAELGRLRAELASVDSDLAAFKDNDPEAFKAMCAASESAKLAANRWTDNLDCLMSWCKRQFAGREDDLVAFFKENGATDLEYME